MAHPFPPPLRRAWGPSPAHRSITLLAAVLLAIAMIHTSALDSSNGRGTPPISPIRNLEPSLAASAAQSTAVAVWSELLSDDDEGDEDEGFGDESDLVGECVVLLSRSPTLGGRAGHNLTSAGFEEQERASASSSSSFSPQEESPISTDSRQPDERTGGRNRRKPYQLLNLPPSRGPILLPPGIDAVPSLTLHALSPSTLAAVTGFAPDVRHLTSYAAKKASDHEHIYPQAKGRGLDAHRMARDVLGGRMMQACMGDGGRPYGVQALVVGGTSRSRIRRALHIYGIDPSGGWRYYGGGGSAVGRKADVVRRELYGILHGDNDVTEGFCSSDGTGGRSLGGMNGLRLRGPWDALDAAMMAIVRSTQEEDEGEGIGSKTPPSRFEAVVMLSRGPGQRCHVAAFHPDSVVDSYRRCAKLAAEGQGLSKALRKG